MSHLSKDWVSTSLAWQLAAEAVCFPKVKHMQSQCIFVHEIKAWLIKAPVITHSFDALLCCSQLLEDAAVPQAVIPHI